ncbi:DUF1007 family protein [Yokenella regensburgei]|uniref:DUF1007 family protein n=1 Tax=Yokenella regensburgei TaxID=158877 RepID=UPI003F15A0A0
MQAVKPYALGLILTFLSSAVTAHPHSFIRLKTEVMVENGQWTGLLMRWTMDEITSADLLYDAGDARPGDEIWKKLAAEVMANVLGQHYFTEVWHNGKKVRFVNRPLHYGMEREGHQAVLTFALPLAAPQTLNGQSYTFSTFDPTYYVDMSYEHDSDVTLAAELRAKCKLSLHTPHPGDDVLDYAQSLDKADAPEESMELGKQFAQTVTLQCQ